MRLLLDTNAYSDFRQFGTWKEKLSYATEILIPTIVLGELKYGFAKGKIQGKNLRMLSDFLRSPRVRVAEISEATSTVYAQLFLYLATQGTPIPSNDIWISAVALDQEAVLLTRDRHFESLPQVDVIFTSGN